MSWPCFLPLLVELRNLDRFALKPGLYRRAPHRWRNLICGKVDSAYRQEFCVETPAKNPSPRFTTDSRHYATAQSSVDVDGTASSNVCARSDGTDHDHIAVRVEN
jgi:hypothetical protein